MKKRLQPKFLLGPAASLLLAVLLSGCTTLLCLWIQPNSLRAVLAVFRAQPLLIVLNCLPIGLLILAVSFLLRNIFSSTALVGFCCALLSLGNRIKLEVRDEPVFPRDLALLKEVGSAMNHYDIHWPLSVFAAISLEMGVSAPMTPTCARSGNFLLVPQPVKNTMPINKKSIFRISYASLYQFYAEGIKKEPFGYSK